MIADGFEQQDAENRVREKSSSRSLKASEVNPEKPIMQRVYHRENDRLTGNTILCGRRYVDPQPVELPPLPIVDRKGLTTIGSVKPKFVADFALTCDWARLSPEERANAWDAAHWGTYWYPTNKAIRIYAAIARSLTIDEILSAREGITEEK